MGKELLFKLKECTNCASFEGMIPRVGFVDQDELEDLTLDCVTVSIKVYQTFKVLKVL